MAGETEPIVAKLGGSIMRDAQDYGVARDVILSDPRRRYIIVSAPGAGRFGEPKVTDQLINNEVDNVIRRFAAIAGDLSVTKADVWLGEVENGVARGESADWRISRGEWLAAQIFADFLRASFVDAAEFIRTPDGKRIDTITYQEINTKLARGEVIVIPGFYGISSRTGAIKTLGRNGSDVTGAIVASGLPASSYENWKDVNGVKSAHTASLQNAPIVPELTYSEMRELALSGVLHMDAVRPAANAKIPIEIRNISYPEGEHTLVKFERESRDGERILAIAGKKGFASLQIDRYGMSEEVGFVERVLDPFRVLEIPVSHLPTGEDFISVIFDTGHFSNGITFQQAAPDILAHVRRHVPGARITLLEDIGVVAVVGQQIPTYSREIKARIFGALSNAHIDTISDIHRPKGNSIILLVEDNDVNTTIEAVYNEFLA